MKEETIKVLVRSYYESTFGEAQDFPFWGDLCDMYKDPENKFYELLGFKPKDSYSAKEVFTLRKLDAKRDYKTIISRWNVKDTDSAIRIINKAGAKSSVLKKSAVPVDLQKEIKVLSEYIRIEKSLALSVGGENVSVGDYLKAEFESLKTLEEVASHLTPIVAGSLSHRQTPDYVKAMELTLFTSKKLKDSEFLEVVKCALISNVIPFAYMDLRKAFNFRKSLGVYLLTDSDETYVAYLDQLHASNSKMPEVIKSLGMTYYNALEVYSKLGVIAFRPTEQIISVSNEHAKNFMMSPSEFEYCRAYGYLDDIKPTNSGLVVVSVGAPLNVVRGAI